MTHGAGEIHPADPRDPRLLLVITDLGGDAS